MEWETNKKIIEKKRMEKIYRKCGMCSYCRPHDGCNAGRSRKERSNKYKNKR